MTAPRILFVDHTGMLGGAELSLLDIAVAFRDRCAVGLFEDGPFAAALVTEDVALLTVSAASSLSSVKKGSRVPGLAAMSGTVVTAFRLARTARRFDLLYANSLKSFVVSVIAGVMVGKPVIWHLRDILDHGHFSRMNVRILATLANRRAARVVVNSHATAEAFIAAGGRRRLVRVVHNGIDPSRFDRLPSTTRGTTRAELGIPADAFVVGGFSRLHEWKGQNILLDALANTPGVHAIVAGGALFSGEQPYEQMLRDRASRAPLAGRVHILGARYDVPALITACDVVAHTSILPEPFGRVLVEALLAGRPIIATDAGGVREIVRHDETALLTPPGDASALAAAITSLRDNPARARALASAGQADMREHFTRDAMVAGVRSVIDDVLSGQRA